MAEIITKQQGPETLLEIMEDVMPTYSGHPSAGEPAVEEPPKTPTEEKPLEATPPVKKPDTEIKEPVAQEPKPKPEESVFKYKSHEEAERGYSEAEKLITKSTDEAKRERERSEDLQRQLNEALLKTGTPEKPQEEASPAQITNAVRMQNLLEEVNQLDPEDEDYNQKVAEIWGRLDDDRQVEFETRMQTAIKTYDEQRQEEQRRVGNEQSAQDQVISDAVKTATSEGLDMGKDSSDSELFWAFANMAPEGSLEDQTKWTIDKVKGHKKPVVIDKKRAEEVQEQNAVLERAGEKPLEKKEPVVPLTLGAAFGKTERRI
jgi:hypothetical protein